jgi:hypothetical protein
MMEETEVLGPGSYITVSTLAPGSSNLLRRIIHLLSDQYERLCWIGGACSSFHPACFRNSYEWDEHDINALFESKRKRKEPNGRPIVLVFTRIWDDLRREARRYAKEYGLIVLTPTEGPGGMLPTDIYGSTYILPSIYSVTLMGAQGYWTAWGHLPHDFFNQFEEHECARLPVIFDKQDDKTRVYALANTKRYDCSSETEIAWIQNIDTTTKLPPALVSIVAEYLNCALCCGECLSIFFRGCF